MLELESAITREREFNSAHSRVNAEYLVNILRKFLLSDDKNEKAQLVIAITQILHIRNEESKIIIDKWSVNKKTGIAGWFSSSNDSSA